MIRFWTGLALVAMTMVASGQKEEVELPELFSRYCLDCHGGKKVEGEFDLTTGQTYESWSEAHHLVDIEEMPSKGPEPSASERQAMLGWLEERIAAATPERGTEVPHFARLTRSQYNHTMRDLLGIDLRPGDLLEADGQGPSGFRNDRASLSITPGEMEKYFQLADRAISGLQALGEKPISVHLETEEMRTASSQLRPIKEGLLFVAESQLASETIQIPADGYYEVTLHSATYGKPVVAQLLVGTEVQGRIPVSNPVPETQPNSTIIFLRAGQPEISVNSRNLVPQPSLPRDANYVFNERAAQNAMQVPDLPADAPESQHKARESLIAKCVALQQAFEWLRGMGVDGDSRDIDRFRKYANERIVGTETVRVWYGTEILGKDPQKWDAEWNALNRDRIQNNQHLLDRVAHVEWGDWLEYQGKLYVDSIDVRGPIVPDSTQEVLDLSGDPRQLIQEHVSRAFRREPKQREVRRYLELYEAVLESGSESGDALRLAMSAVLASPHFLFHHDASLASRLSYFLWQSMPDEELLQREAEGTLSQPEELQRQLRRMTEDPRFAQSASIFMEEWLGTADLGGSLNPDPFQYPEFSPEVLRSAKEEPTRLLLHLIDMNLPVTQLLGADYAIVDETLAGFYGLSWSQGKAGWQVIPASAHNRGGLLGMSAVLTATSTSVRTSPSSRGAWVWETLLGKEVGDPLPDAGILAATAGEANGKTLREEMELHRTDPRCIRCHEIIDPIGLGLENYNAVGRWRDEMAGTRIDPSGQLSSGETFSTPGELKAQLLVGEEDFANQVARTWTAYALGRELSPHEADAVKQMVKASGGRARDLLEEIVTSDLFLGTVSPR